ncbi:MAG: undecaprenyldiphospho-muramoylpentapeptide beta-N-acetylglucosaminyltransferase [Gammaproteobacteria bacterium]|nr:undecaprenyldiphospho-muramoylpentapeptide beta-N-acetylglucosaminyltransferase [Gammaproteobacteria bacterium]
MSARVVIMAGGTGGHVIPALTIAERLRERGLEVSWLGTRRGLEADLVPRARIEIDWLRVTGLRGNGAVGWALAPFRLGYALAQALRALRRRRPAAVLGMGGFAAGPGGVAAWLLGLPLVVHEQNAVAGLTNSLLARLADRVLEAFPGTFPPSRAAEATGNPVRAAIVALPRPALRFAVRTGPLRLLVLGGSLGAAALNEAIPAAAARLPGKLEIRHQCGARHVEAARAAYAGAGVDAEVLPFIDDMAGAYGWADLVICRAGALTVAELAAAGVGALLVPFPHAVDDHQTANARYLVAAGAAELIPQERLEAADLGERIAALADDRGRLAAMAEAARAVARPEAADAVVAACLRVAGLSGDARWTA